MKLGRDEGGGGLLKSVGDPEIGGNCSIVVVVWDLWGCGRASIVVFDGGQTV